ncbi:MAG TPA: hypothetical protein V6D33_18130 [Cyanophyceae cyanobacterium]
MTLPSDRGAKYMIQSHIQAAIRVPLPLGAIDIDTLRDYERFLHMIT